MVSFTLTSVSAAAMTLIALASAAPSTTIEQRQTSSVTVTFIGAAGAQFTQSIPFDSQFTQITNDLSISHIQTSGGPCIFFGVDGGVFHLLSAGYGDFGPPQSVVGGVCGPIPGQ